VDAAKHTLTPKPVNEGVLEPGSGPRHGVFSGGVFYCISEMALTVTPFLWDAKAATLTAGKPVSTLQEGVAKDGKYSTAEIVAHPNGKTLYGSNRGHNTIAVYSITDPDKGEIKQMEVAPAGVKVPRNINLTPDGKWLLSCGQDSDDIAVFAVKPEGTLSPTEHKATVGKPVCVVFVAKE